MPTEAFIQAVHQTVKKIPKGKVTTYGQIAYMINHPKNARLVGNVLHRINPKLNLPCHRVVNHSGRLVPGWNEQQALLQKEGVLFKSNGNVDLRRYFWQG
ncbi:MGMT family protein [Listeria sp. PSOL-1]|uniref:MGMT family protein n=1 Tax=Listeria sp. PSOL-1 TaxID=1844999 RepID=UPI0013CF4B2B|nr:MGMT family protein [Listeria sp. PSOL-1]